MTPPADEKDGISLRDYIDLRIAGLRDRIDILLKALKEEILASQAVADKEAARHSASTTILVAIVGVIVSIVTIAVIVYMGRK